MRSNSISIEDVETTTAADVMSLDVGVTRPTKTLKMRRTPVASPKAQLAALNAVPIVAGSGEPADFQTQLRALKLAPLQPRKLEVFQINLGKLCNMTCRHCHVDAGPDRTDAMMSRDVLEDCLAALRRSDAHTVDITGGAPELHPEFRYLVDQAKRLGKHVIDRCNLTVLLVPKFRTLPAWLAKRGVEVVASMPHCRRRNTDAQRGDGTYLKSIEAIRMLNAVGYGKGDPGKILTLMSNPTGAYLAANQAEMEADWKAHLAKHEGVTFDRLFALNNMPISRFLDWLDSTGNLQPYLQRLVDTFNPAAVEGLMCRNTISVSWDGKVYDCDFNQMLDIEAEGTAYIGDFDAEAFANRRICTARHCFGCTAGAGSSCGGATT